MPVLRDFFSKFYRVYQATPATLNYQGKVFSSWEVQSLWLYVFANFQVSMQPYKSLNWTSFINIEKIDV